MEPTPGADRPKPRTKGAAPKRDKPAAGEGGRQRSTKAKVEAFKPQAAEHPAEFLPNPDFIRVLDQGTEGSAVGHGMAAMINYLLRERGIHDQVSPRMLQQLSKQYGGRPLDLDEGSMLPDGMRAWLERGVCSASLWPYRAGEWGEFTPERERAAEKFKPLGYRSVPKSVSTMKAAVAECHAVAVGATVHQGWMTDEAKAGVIPFQGNEQLIGGHAFAILGYTDQGFLIQNSWSSQWGGVEIHGRRYPGCVLWSFPDFQASYGEGFVANLPDSLNDRPRLRRAGYQSDAAQGTDLLDIRSDVEAVCAVLATRDVKPPLALGLFGNWGTGKSFFMAKMHEEIESLARLERENPGQTPYCGRVVQIRFNAWHFLDANLWASLVAEVFKSLFEALSDPSESNQASRRRIIRQLGAARGLYRQSQMELEAARQEHLRAQSTLQARQEAVKAQQSSLRGLRDELIPLLAGDPAVKQELDRLAEALGQPELAQSLRVLQQQVAELGTLGGSAKRLWEEVRRPEGRGRRLLLLVACTGLCALALPAARNLVSPDAGFLGSLRAWLNSTTGALVGLTAWLAPQVARLTSAVRGLKQMASTVEAISVKRLDALTQVEQRELEIRLEAEREAGERLEQARQLVEALECDLRELDPVRQLKDYIKDRAGSEDYRKELGLVSLVRRDFDRLSQLLTLTEAMEDRWYAAKQKAAEANQPFRRPKRSLLPMRRIVLYIDDLDRCRPERVIEVLEAVHLLLAFPLFVVVVAVDPRWLRQCLEMHYPKLLATSGQEGAVLTEPSTPQDYLEKIFQIPYYLRPISPLGYRNLIDGLMSPDLEVPAPPPVANEATTPVPGAATVPPWAGAAAPGVLNLQRPALGNGPPGQAAADDLVKVNPERLRFRQWEINDMKRLAKLFRTPRAVKRFVNTYRLIRVSIPEMDMGEFIGTESAPGRYRIAQGLLAVVCGYPNVATEFLQSLLRQARTAGTWTSFLANCRAAHGAPDAGAGPRSPAKKTSKTRAVQPPGTQPSVAKHLGPAQNPSSGHGQEWRDLCDALGNLDPEFFPGELERYYDLALRAARFSFSVSELPE